MNEYRSLKDLPGAPKGTVINRKVDSMHYRVGPVLYSEFDIKMLPDWFEIVQPESLESAVDRTLKEWRLYSGSGSLVKMQNAMLELDTIFNRIKHEGKA